MNSLSWLVYLAEFLGRLGIFAFLAAMFSAAFVGIGLFAGIMFRGDAKRDAAGRYGEPYKSAGIESLAFWDDFLATWPKRGAVSAVFFGVIALATPSSQTIYMIAASEMGERVVSQPETKEMLGDLREVIAKQIKKLKDDK